MESNSHGMSLGQIFAIALKRWWIILIAAVLGAGLMLGYTHYFVQPLYTSEARIGVTIPDMNAYNDSMTGQKVARECSDILRSDLTLNRAASKLNNENPNITYTGANLRAMVSTVVDEETRFFSVRVTSRTPAEAQRVCEAVITSFNVVLKDRNIINSAEGIILDDATYPTSPSSPDMTTNALVGAVIGFVISLAILLVIGFFTDAVDGEDYIINTYGHKVPMLAVIPDANSGSRGYKKYSRKYGYGYGYGYGYEPKGTEDK